MSDRSAADTRDDAGARLDALEAKLAFQEDAVQQLSDALIAQQSRIDRLEARVDVLTAQLREADDGDDVPEPPPPHY